MDIVEYDRQLASYDQLLATGEAGNPTPVDALALVFRDGRACVCVRVRGLKGWIEVMSAPVTAPEGLACGVDGRRPEAFVTAELGIATGFAPLTPE